jgi:carbon-monoxide dehydrogenase medium subunit
VLRPFTLHRPETAEEACALLAGLGDDAAPYAGGTELLLLMKLGVLRPRHLVDVKRIRGFGDIRLEPHVDRGANLVTALDAPGTDAARLTIGAAVTHRTVERSAVVRARCPLVSSVASHVANVRVRNVGTVGGNLAFADPHSDLATLFLTLDATIELLSPRGRREVPLADFVHGPWETTRAADELLGSVTLTPWSRETAAAYVKFGMHERPTLAVAAALRLDGTGGLGRGEHDRIADARVAVGCVSPRPTRIPEAETRLKDVSMADLEDAARVASDIAAATVDPADDLYGSADYKRAMVAVFVGRALRVAAARARGAEPAARFPHAVVA